MDKPDLASRMLWHAVLVIGWAACASPAFAAFFLDLTAASGHQVQVVLKSDTPILDVESIDIELSFNTSSLQLIGMPTFEPVLTGVDFKFADCRQRVLPSNLVKTNCGGFFDPERAPLESGDLLSWLINVVPNSPQPPKIDVSVMLGEDEPIVLSKVATLPVPEASSIALMLAGLGVLALRAMRRRPA